MKKPPIVLCLLASACSLTAQNFQTVIAPPNTTRYLSVPEGRTVRIVNLAPWSPNYGTDGQVKADLAGQSWNVWKGDVFQGPMQFMVFGETFSSTLITIETLEEMTPPARTLILPQGTNAVAVSLEISTNLTQWVTATNGVYVSGETPRFFRIKAEK